MADRTARLSLELHDELKGPRYRQHPLDIMAKAPLDEEMRREIGDQDDEDLEFWRDLQEF